MKIVVLGGGISSERQVSLVSASSVCKALRSRGHKAIFVDMFFGLEDYSGRLEDIFDVPGGLCPDFEIGTEAPDINKVIASRKFKSPSRIGRNVLQVCAMADCVFLGLHGVDGEDGKIQATLDLLGIPYTGSDFTGSAMAMNKAITKRMVQSRGVNTPPFEEIRYTAKDIPALVKRLPVPCAVKVVDGGSSLGVALPDTREELEKALYEILPFNSSVIIERKITGREMTVPVLDGKALCPIEILPPEGASFDYVAKYQQGAAAARELCPAPVDEPERDKLQRAAEAVHKAMGLSVYSRSDFILDSAGQAWFLEVNTLPGMTPASLIPKSAAHEGISYPELCEKIVLLSLEARKNR